MVLISSNLVYRVPRCKQKKKVAWIVESEAVIVIVIFATTDLPQKAFYKELKLYKLYAYMLGFGGHHPG